MSITVTLNNIKCVIHKLNYPRNNQLALQLVAAEDQVGTDQVVIYKGETVAMPTLVVPGIELKEDETVIKTSDALEVLCQAGIIERTGQLVDIGYATRPVVRVRM